MSLEALKNERERIVRAQKEILAKPVLDVKHDPGLLNKLELRRDVLNMVIMMTEADEVVTAYALNFWLNAKLREKKFIQEEIELSKCGGNISAMIMRWERFNRLAFEIEWLEELVKLELEG